MASRLYKGSMLTSNRQTRIASKGGLHIPKADCTQECHLFKTSTLTPFLNHYVYKTFKNGLHGIPFYIQSVVDPSNWLNLIAC